MLTVVTGVAGFIGSQLAERLLATGHQVRGIDCFTPYYDESIKRANIQDLLSNSRFELSTADLRTADLREVLGSASVIFHLAGQPGVRPSWAEGFEPYVSCNIIATQRLLEAATAVGVPRIVFSSSSSVYGEVDHYPTSEFEPLRPHSPYGVTKMAAESLCAAYGANSSLEVISLRYFSVYGPRQRPDMAAHKIIAAALRGEIFEIYGSGDQLRDFTYVGDVVEANVAAATLATPPLHPMNICGGSETSLKGLVEAIEAKLGRAVEVSFQNAQLGDVRRTLGSSERAREILNWEPKISFADGIAAQIAWQLKPIAPPSGR